MRQSHTSTASCASLTSLHFSKLGHLGLDQKTNTCTRLELLNYDRTVAQSTNITHEHFCSGCQTRREQDSELTNLQTANNTGVLQSNQAGLTPILIKREQKQGQWDISATPGYPQPHLLFTNTQTQGLQTHCFLSMPPNRPPLSPQCLCTHCS